MLVACSPSAPIEKAHSGHRFGNLVSCPGNAVTHLGVSAVMVYIFALDIAYTFPHTIRTHRRKKVLMPDQETGNIQQYCGAALGLTPDSDSKREDLFYYSLSKWTRCDSGNEKYFISLATPRPSRRTPASDWLYFAAPEDFYKCLTIYFPLSCTN